MTKGEIHWFYKSMSADDQRTFDRWLKANLVIGSIVAGGLLAMALASGGALSPGTAAAKQTSAASMVAPVPSAFQLMRSLAPHQLPITEVSEPF